VIAQIISGRWLGSLIAEADWFRCGAFSNAQLLYVSRLPFVMAWDGWLPARFRNATSETAVPKLAMCVCAELRLCSPRFRTVGWQLSSAFYMRRPLHWNSWR